MLSAEAEGATPVTLAYNILALGTYYFPVNVLSKKNRAMHHGMSKLHGLKVIRHVACLVGLNGYLAVFPGAKISETFMWRI